ncbi:hypothetical protein JTE90_020537 [Oedothorax gibbosus]|uniref:Uncharacterized protein n=1 Tax=Oedothorax gibbosus TaxID=931172 RepID=A0AAV6VYJ2_9ARAC|nr:hypothetical protein JTE90_020537 [Oedothorax gibbosus]
MDIRFVKGQDNTVADAMSRIAAISLPTPFNYEEMSVSIASSKALSSVTPRSGGWKSCLVSYWVFGPIFDRIWGRLRQNWSMANLYVFLANSFVHLSHLPHTQSTYEGYEVPLM